jgi:Tol biopolymer transport system component
MPPEQLEGQETDARADIFSFGAVLYEMVTGRAAFQGKSQVTLISAIVSSEPAPASTLRAEVPPLLDHVLKRCLAKEPNARWQTVSDVLHELKWIVEEKPSATSIVPMEQIASQTTGRTWIALSAVLGLALVVLAVFYFRIPVPESIPMRLSVNTPPDTTLPTISGGAPWPTLSPDGRRMVFGVSKEDKTLLYLRALDSETAQPLSGTEDAEQPFWSPDGRYIAFFSQNKLKKIDTSGGGAPQTLCNVTGNPREGTWGADDTILFATGGPLWRLSAAGGEPQPLTELDKSRGEVSHLYPSFLPDHRHFVFLAAANDIAQSSISIGDLDSKSIKHLLNLNTKAQYAAPGYLLYVRESALTAQPFDAKRLELSGQAFPIVENIRHTVQSGIAAFSVANNGTIAYRTSGGGDSTDTFQLVWYDRSGHATGRFGTPGVYLNPEISPDGKQVAVERAIEGARDIWLLELARGIFNRFTTERGATPLWSRGGNKIMFLRPGQATVFEQPVNGNGKPEVLGKQVIPEDISPDGKELLYTPLIKPNGFWVVPLEGSGQPHVLQETRFSERNARFSPNGRWIVYTSDESGRNEIYARSYPSNENKIQISTNTGTKARWSRDGKEIFYVSADYKLIAVPVRSDKKLEVGTPQTLFGTSFGILNITNITYRQPYDVTADGKRFLLLDTVESKAPPPITVFSNWQATVKRGN